MNTTLVLTVTICLLIACVVYFFMEYRAHGQRDKAMSDVLSVQAKLNAADKKAKGFTRYLDHLDAAVKSTADQTRAMTHKVVREYTYLEKMPKGSCKEGALASVAVKYAVEYPIGVDLRPESVELLATTAGLNLKTPRPAVMGAPFIKTLSHEVLGPGVLLDEPATLKEVHEKFRDLTQRYGPAIALEEPTRALFRTKLAAHVAEFLAAQPGVTQVPVISVEYK